MRLPAAAAASAAAAGHPFPEGSVSPARHLQKPALQKPALQKLTCVCLLLLLLQLPGIPSLRAPCRQLSTCATSLAAWG
jgi:hypothetical protein